jgi:hypothetical protein
LPLVARGPLEEPTRARSRSRSSFPVIEVQDVAKTYELGEI